MVDLTIAADQRRNQIIEAAIKTLMTKGISASSMNDLIRASGFSKGGVYHYFPSKDNLLAGILNYFFEEYFIETTEVPSKIKSAHQKLRYMLTQHQQILEEMGQYNPLFLDFFAHSAHNPQLKQQFQFQYLHFQTLLTKLIQQGINDKEFKPDINARAIASGIIGVFDGICIAMSVAPQAVEFPGYAVQSALSIIEGIRKYN